MAEHNELGKHGEELAVAYLQENGYEVLARNWTFRKAEIDIIARKGDIVAIIEVKTRSSIDFGLPQEFVKKDKIQHLVRAADKYIIENGMDVEVRFDIIAIQKEDKDFKIEHLEDAFYHF